MKKLIYVLFLLFLGVNAQSNYDAKIIDTDKDGIIDSFDKCPKSWGLIKNGGCFRTASMVLPMKKNIYKRTIFFNSGKIKLENQNKKVLDDLISVLKEFPNKSIEVDGHSDEKETENNNRLLSEKRTIVVLEYLVSKGVSISRFSLNGYGSEHSMPNKETNSNNRRVDIRLYK